MNSISPKVIAGAGAAGSSMPLPLIIIWLLGLFHVAVPPEVAIAIATEIASAAALWAGYATPHNAAPQALLDQIAQMQTQIRGLLPAPKQTPMPAFTPAQIPQSAPAS